MSKIITIIGSRTTPQEILAQARIVAKVATTDGWIVRSGKAQGMDTAAIYGCMDAYVAATILYGRSEAYNEAGAALGIPEMYTPWPNFGDKTMTNAWDSVQGENFEAMGIAACIHPAWRNCSQGAQKLHARNVCQIHGADLNTPSDVVLYYCKEVNGNPTGGTATAVNLAKHSGCICINMLHIDWQDKLYVLGINIDPDSFIPTINYDFPTVGEPNV